MSWDRNDIHNEDIIEDDRIFAAYGEEDDGYYEYCTLCGERLRPNEMSKDIDGYCLQCVAEVIGSVNAMALRELTVEEYELYRLIYEPVEDVA